MNLSISLANWGWPQWMMTALIVLALLINAMNDGKPKNSTYSFGVTLIAKTISVFILIAGGFFK